MWRGCSTKSSAYTRSSAKYDFASLCVRAKASATSDSARTTRMPLPPPPAAALRRSGKPFSLPKAATSAADAAGVVMPGTTGTPAAIIRWRDSVLLPIAAIENGRGPDPGEARVDDGLREGGVLGQEAEAGVDERRTRLPGGGEELLGDEVALARRRRADRHGVVREAHVERAAVGLGVDRDGRDRRGRGRRG